MFLISSIQRLLSAAFEFHDRHEATFLSAAADAGDLERRLARLDTSTRERASGIVAGLYPR